MGKVPEFLASFDCLMFVTYLGTAIILLNLARSGRQGGGHGSRQLTTLGLTYLFVAMVMAGHLVLNTIYNPPVPVRSVFNPVRFVWEVWHLGLGVGIILYACAGDQAQRDQARRDRVQRDRVQRHRPRLLPRATAIVLLALASLVVMPLTDHIVIRLGLTSWFAGDDLRGTIGTWLVLAVDGLALAAMLWRRGLATTLDLWITTALFAVTLELVLAGYGVQIYSRCWYWGRLLDLAGSVVVISMLINRLLELYHQTMVSNLRLASEALTDSLTSLANRRAFDQALDTEWRRARRENSELSLLMIDLDLFKRVNDRYGHPAGDQYLITVARELKRVVKRPADLVARIGGEEFAILLPNTSARGALHLAELIRHGIESLALANADTSAKILTASVGVATLAAGFHQTPANCLLAAADRALYAAKDQGRNRIAVAPMIEPLIPDTQRSVA